MADGLLTQPLRDFGRGYNREAVAGLLGAPVDMTTQLINLLIAGGGYAAHKAGLVNQPPDLIDPARAVGSSDWIYQRLPAQPALTGSKSEQAGRLAGALLSPPAVMQAAPKVTRTLAQALREKLPIVADNYMARSGMAPNIVAYHGSPHSFDQFDSSKIGTGEGVQAYGHGLYLAESPDVATSYKNLVQRDPTRLTVDGAVVSPDTMYGRHAEDVARIGVKATLQKIDDSIRFNEKYAPDMASLYKSLRAQIEALDPSRVNLKEGNLYKVDLPDPLVARMLDWDKPLSQQAPQVQKGLEPIVAPIRAVMREPADAKWGELASPQNYDPLGKDLLQLLAADQSMSPQNVLSGGVGPRAASRARAMGIPGIRYLDGGSRGAGAGTSNFVVFPGEENALTILERNNQPLQTRKGSR